MTDDWYVRRGQKTLGPLSAKRVRRALADGRISAETPVRRGTSGAWTKAGEAFGEPVVDHEPESEPTDAPGRFPFGLAGFAGLAVVIAGIWFALKPSHDQTETPDPAVTRESDAPRAATPNANAGSQAILDRKPRQNGRLPDQAASRLVLAKSPRQSAVIDPKVTASVKTQPPGPKPPPGAHAAIVTKKLPAAPPGPVARVVPLVVLKAPAKDADLSALETTARHCPTAKEALALYHQFKATRTMSPTQEATLKANLRIWDERAKLDLARMGDKWVAAADAAKAHEEGIGLVARAIEMIKALNYEEARRTLEKARRTDPNSVAADFVLGLLDSITAPEFRSPPTAVKHFQLVLRRVPGYVPALNNLALAEIRQEKYADAVHHLRDAAERSPASEEVTQNLGRFLSEAKLGRIRPNKSALSEASKLYSKLVVTRQRNRSEQKPGWRYMPLVVPKEERDGGARVPWPQEDSMSCVQQASGFVVARHYVLTCRHVVDDLTLGRADRIEIVDPTDPTHRRRLPATCVEVGQGEDLCLLKCEQLTLPPIPLADKVPPRGTEIVLMGFPGGSDFDLRLKTTRGVMTALPGAVARLGPGWLDFSRLLWYDAASSHGASGGAVCDERGNVVAVHSTDYRPGDDSSSAKCAGGVPAPNAAAFIRGSLPALGHPPNAGPALEWTDVDAKVSPSIVLVFVGYKRVTLAMSSDKTRRAGAAQQSAAEDYDDPMCTACNGSHTVRCRAPGCLYRRVQEDTVVGNSVTVGSAGLQSVRPPCRVCGGTGRVPCPYCSDGKDPTLH
jgi:S1-C subfamily serine protease